MKAEGRAVARAGGASAQEQRRSKEGKALRKLIAEFCTLALIRACLSDIASKSSGERAAPSGLL
jgi:hypothetical protein